MKYFAVISAMVIALWGTSCKPGCTGNPIVRPEEPTPPVVSVPEPDPTGMDDDAVAMAAKMGLGWNLGNTMEPPEGEGTWNNPRVTQQLVKTVAAAGFTTVRIPCAWDSHIINRKTYQIDPEWLDRVAEVVGWCLNEGLYVMLNTHWDGGWLEENPYYSKQAAINTQLSALWNQIATKMRDFDQRLLFAGTNEVHHGYDAPKVENIEVQYSFNQTFVDAVRATGGKNAYRNLVVQAYNTNIDYAVQYYTLPSDSAKGRLLLEVHYYDPWEFTIMGSDNPGLKVVWGNRAEAPVQGDDPRKPTWGDETYADGQFAKMKTNFVDKSIPVIVGEYGSTFRTGLGDNQADHDASNTYYIGYVTRAMEVAGLVPVYWDNGATSDGSGLFDRRTYEIVHVDVLNAIIGK
jgi:endoglucanase